jgi:protein gp37
VSEQSAIEWTDATWNPTTGCTKVSPGCAHCYAETVALRFWPSQYPPVEYDSYSVDACCPITEMRPRQFTDVMVHEDRLDQPLRMKRPRRIFVNSMSDLFHEDVPDTFIAEVWRVMFKVPRHTYQILTKRSERMAAIMPRLVETFGVLSNVWLGVSVENQHFADERIPLLFQTPAAVRFISAEPLLEGITLHPKAARWFQELSRWYTADAFDPTGSQPVRERRTDLFPKLDWVIVGGESGHGARPCYVHWVRSIVGQCKAAGVPVFVKQLGADPRDAAAQRDDMGARDVWPAGWMPTIDGTRVWRPDLTSRKGGDMAEWPEDLRVREFPSALTMTT